MKTVNDDKPIVVISGMSGRLPGVNNVTDYAERLYNKEELVGPTKGRYSTSGIFEELPDSIGRVEDFEKFDNEFFNIKPELAKLMDPQVRKMLEVTLEAILDAGLKLDEIKGPRTGAFFGHIYSDLDRTLKVNDLVERQNSCSDPSIAFYRQLFQQWISYCLDLSGPTYHYESACSSAMYAISDAFRQIQLGLIDTALVITANLNLPPNLTVQYFRLGIMSPTGVCRFADQNADGYVKAEAVCALVLQRYDPKLSDVKRIYSRIVNTKCNSDGWKLEGITFPQAKTQYQLIKETFEEVGLEPTQVNYVEAHGTGTQTGDIQELSVIDDIFNNEELYGKRKSQLYIGSVKSNIGHAEGASGICSIIKCLFCYMYDKIPPIVNFSTPNPNIPSLLNGKIKLVLDTMPLNTDYISCSSFGFGGSNTHVILQNSKSIPGIQDNHLSSRKLNAFDGYQLVNLAARTEQGLLDCLGKLAQQFRAYDLNLNEVHLLNDVVFREQIKLGFNHTGHMIINLNDPKEEPSINLNKEFINPTNLIDYHKSTEKVTNKNKLFYAVPGLGCQWRGMAICLMEIPFFDKRLRELCDIIQPELEFDIFRLMIADSSYNNPAFADFDDSIFCLVALAIFQISFLDLLKEIGLKPDGYFGHSFGELICAYQDGICDARQVLKATLVVSKLKQRYDELDKQNKPINNFLFENGAMTVVGLSWEQTLKEIEESKVIKVNAACNNSIDCVTVSGAEKEVEKFQSFLTEKGIFNRRVASCGMAFHCELVKDFYDYLLREFNKIFKDQVKRSNKWLSTSINPFSEEESVSWLNNNQNDNKKEKQTFAQYFANCILKPVLFKEACDKMILDLEDQEKDSVNQVFVLEIAPRSFVTSLMKSNTTKVKSITYLPGFSLIKKDKLFEKPNNNLQTLLKVLGTLNNNGIFSSSSKLYQNSTKLINGSLSNGHHLTNGDTITESIITKKSINSSATLKQKSDHIAPIITNRLALSSFLSWDHTIDFPVPAYPEFFSLSIDQNKIDLNSTNYQAYLPDKTTRYRLPISFYLEVVLNQFKKLNSTIVFSTLHIQDLMVYRLEELNEQELDEVNIELIEFGEQNSLGQIYKFLVKNCNEELILSGNLAASTEKYSQQNEEIEGERITSSEFYKRLNLEDDKQYLIKEPLLITNEQITGQLDCGWTKQLDAIMQLYAFFNRKSIVAEIDKQTLQVHSIIIKLDKNENDGNEISYNNQSNLGQSTQIELKGIQLNSLNQNEEDNKIVVDQNSNIDLRNRQNVVNELNSQKLNVNYFKTNCDQPNLHFIDCKNQQVGFLDKNDKYSKQNCWSIQTNEIAKSALSYLSLLDGYLIALDILNNKCKLNYKLQSSFLSLEENLGILIALCDLLTLADCDVYVLLNDRTKVNLIENCFSSRKNLKVLNPNDLKDDYDLQLLRLTNGEGTQLVISNSMNKDEFNKSINCLSLNSKFIHLNNEKINVQNHPLGMSLFLKNIDFHALTLNEMSLEELVSKNLKAKLQDQLNSIDSIIKELDKFNQFDLEKLFNVNFI